MDPATSGGAPRLSGDLAELLAGWMPRQRWFAGKGREFTVRATELIASLPAEPPLEMWLVTVDYTDGQRETYQVPLVAHHHPHDNLAHVLVGERDGTWVYDGLHDKSVTGALLRGIAAEAEVGGVRFRRAPGSEEIDTDVPSLVMGAEQSNTSLVFGDSEILKVFRKLVIGVNPDIEVHAALAKVGNTDIAPILGWVEGRWTDPEIDAVQNGSLAMLQRFLRTASEGWHLAIASVRDLFAEGDLHPDEVGGDFASEAYRLGSATAEVHRDLAETLETGTAGPAELAEIAAGMRGRLEAAVAAVPQLAPYAAGLAGAFDDLAGLSHAVPLQRVHGDLHLGQAMRTETGWVLLDFEGEPAKPLEERVALSSPLRDVAGMLRSFDYASRHLLADHPGDAQLLYRAGEWAERNREAFCDGYAAAAGVDPRKEPVLLRAYEIDKAIYEAVYEARNRPTWLRVPMAAIERLAA